MSLIRRYRVLQSQPRDSIQTIQYVLQADVSSLRLTSTAYRFRPVGPDALIVSDADVRGANTLNALDIFEEPSDMQDQGTGLKVLHGQL